MLYLEKNSEVILFESFTLISENRSKIISIGAPITKKRLFKKLKNLSFLASFISTIKIADIFDFLSVKYFGKGLLFPKFWLIRVNYCWSYGPSNLLFRFFHFRLGYLYNRQTKIEENSTIYFWKLTPKQRCGKSLKFFDPPTTKWRSFKFFAKLNGNHILMTNLSKLAVNYSVSCVQLLGRRTYNFWNSDFLTLVWQLSNKFC